MIKQLNRTEINDALPLVWKVFCHIALFFVDGDYHHRGIGRMLWNAVRTDSKANEITVHSSLYAVEVYKKLGFVQTAGIQEDGGIQYVPIVYV